MKRRELMIGTGGFAAALLTGRIPEVEAQDTDSVPQRQVETPETALELLPPESRIDDEYVRVLETTIDAAEDTNQIPYGISVTDAIDSLDISDIETFASGWTSDGQVIQTVSGSFDRQQYGERVESHDDWWVGTDDSEGITVASTEGLLLFVDWENAETRVDIAEAGMQVGRGIEKSVVDRIDTLEVAFDHFGEKKVFYYVPNIGDGFPTEVREKLESVSAGFEISPAKVRGYDGTLEDQFLLEQSAGADFDEADVEEIVREIEQGTIVELDFEVDGAFVFVDAVVDAPPERNQEAAPDAQVTLNGNPDAGTATLEHQSGETINAETLELWINGELADTQPAAEFDLFEPGDSFTVETGPLANVFLRWVNEDANQYFEYVDDVVGDSLFETTYDQSAGTAEFTYTGENDVNTDLLELEHRWDVTKGDQTRYEREQLTGPIADLGETMTNGNSIIVDGVDLRDTVTLGLDVPSKPPGTFGPKTTLVRVRAREPEFSIYRRPNEGPVVEYYGQTARDAERFRILFDGEEAGTQLANEHDTLEHGDQLSLDTVPLGTEIVIEWLGGETPVTVESKVMKPLMLFDISYDDSDGTVTVEHTEGEEVDADTLELLLDGTPAETQPGDTYETFSTGDTLTTTADPFTRVEIRWSDGETELTLTERATGQNLFRGSYDPSSNEVELTYIGQQPADPERIKSETYGDVSRDGSQRFADTYEMLTAGDSVTVEDVDPDGVVQVVLSGGETVPGQILFYFRPKPAYAFEFENREGSVVARYRSRHSRDAAAFRILADGTEVETQPGDEYETLEEGDEIELGSFSPGTTIVVEWHAGNEATEIDRHVVVPAVEFEGSYDEDAGVVRIEHAGGNEVAASDLGIYVPQVTERPVEWDSDGTVSEGDSMTIDAEEKPSTVVIVYRERQTLAELELDG